MSDLRLIYEGEFEERLFAQSPSSVLDIGCGEGGFLRRAAAKGIRAAGIDANPARVEKTRQDGLDTHHAEAHALPFADQSFDWAVCERSAHHFTELAASVREILRVARNLAVFDPWYDESIPSQKLAADLDRWMKRVHRSGGHINNGPLSSADLVAALPDDIRFDISFAGRVNLQAAAMDDVMADAEKALAHGSGDVLFRQELNGLLARANTTGVSGTGAILFFAARA